MTLDGFFNYMNWMKVYGKKHNQESIGMQALLGNGNTINFHYRPQSRHGVDVDDRHLTLDEFYDEYLSYSGLSDVFVANLDTGNFEKIGG